MPAWRRSTGTSWNDGFSPHSTTGRALAEMDAAWQSLQGEDDRLPGVIVASLAAQIVTTSFGNLTRLYDGRSAR